MSHNMDQDKDEDATSDSRTTVLLPSNTTWSSNSTILQPEQIEPQQAPSQHPGSSSHYSSGTHLYESSAQTPLDSLTYNGGRSSASLPAQSQVKEQERELPDNMASRRPVWTPASLAKEYLQKEIDTHSRLEAGQMPDVAVIFHDACYGHRYSRPRTSKADLSTIVERPERILAIALGVSAAYVLLGGHHAEGAHTPRPGAGPTLPPFLIRKSSRSVDLTSAAVTNVHGSKWMADLKIMCEAAESKLMQNGKELVRPKDPNDSSQQHKPRLHEGDLYLCAESLAAFEGALGGVLDGVDAVFDPKGPRRVFACVRPPGHHCSDDYPSGFCWLNNVHVGISHAAQEHGLTHAAIFDFDLHHGDGSQAIAWAHNTRAMSLRKNAAPSRKTSIGYYSLHDINSYPCEYGEEDKVRNASLCIENAHGQNVWNVHLQPWKTEADFWKLYNDKYSVLIEKMRAFLATQYQKLRSTSGNVQPKGAIFISAGFDASEWEGQGMQRHNVNVPTSFYARVTRDIVKLAQEEGLGVDGRVLSVLEGGYSDRALASGVLSHMCGLSSQSSTENTGDAAIGLSTTYSESWWSTSRLEELERNGNSTPSPALTKKSKSDTASSYHTPTQSFVAKVVSAPTYQRSVANSISQHISVSKARARSPTPPLPEVNWVTASYELSQLIIPQDRQTRSCQAEELNTKATEARKNRQSIVSSASLATDDNLETRLDKMNLRDRRAKTPNMLKEEPRPESSMAANRRKTFGGIEVLQKEIVKPSNRRLSVASTTLSADDSFVKSSTPPAESSATKVRAPPKARAPRKTATKPSVPKPVANKKAVASPTDADGSSPNLNKDGGIDDLVSGMKNIRIKLNVPPKAEHDRKEAAKSTASRDVKKPVRAPRKSAIKKPLPTDPALDSKPSNRSSPPLPVAVTNNIPQSPSTTPLQISEPITNPLSTSETFAVPPTVSSPTTIPTSSSTTTTEHNNINTLDKILFNQTSHDPQLAAYLAPVSEQAAPWTVPLPYSPPQNNKSRSQLPSVDHSPSPMQQGRVSTKQSPARRHNLPAFTSSSPIPFAPKSASISAPASAAEIPDSPMEDMDIDTAGTANFGHVKEEP